MRTMRIEESLKQFVSSSNIKIDHVVDVGVQWGTPFLIEAFPDAKTLVDRACTRISSENNGTL
jgi:hypothetical protein